MSIQKERFEILDFQKFLGKIRKNEPRAWNQLDFVLKRIILRWIVKKGIAVQDVKDIYNDTITVFLEKFNDVEFDSFTGMKSYVFSIAENKIKEYYRKLSKLNLNEPVDKLNVSSYVEYLGLIDSEEKKEQIKKIYNLLSRLTQQEREIMILAYQQEKSLKEIAAILNLNEGNVRVIKHRAIEKIRKWLNQS